MKAGRLDHISIEEYLSLEEESGTKYEYHNGQIYALAGGSLNHGLLCGNIYAELRSELKVSTCKPLTSELKLHISNSNSYVYPDAMVVCGPLSAAEANPHAVTNPTLIVEVLSKSTADYDRGDKFYLYRQLSSLQEYVLIEQGKPVVEVYFKKPSTDLWQINRVEGLDQFIHLQSLDIQISMSELYFDIQF